MLGHFNRHVKSCSVTPYFRVLATGAVLAARFAQAELPFELAELAAEHGLVVLRRRP